MPDQLTPHDLLNTICTFCRLTVRTCRIPTEDDGERWHIHAVSETGVESWLIEAEDYAEAICLLARQLGLDVPSSDLDSRDPRWLSFQFKRSPLQPQPIKHLVRADDL